MWTLEDTINERLFHIYGREPITELPKYRVVRAELQTEKRYGSYDVLTQETGIWLGSRSGLAEIKKYWYLPDCWILERVEANLNRQNIFQDKYMYEPVLPFLDKDNNQLPLNWKAIEFFITRLEKTERRKIFSEEEWHELEEKKLKAEEERDFGIIDAPEPIKELPTFNTSTLFKPVDTKKLNRVGK